LQFALLVGAGYLLIPLYGTQGATMAYFATYAGYLTACLIGFYLFMQKMLKRQPH
jgi:O-antigen/teichoic acid export membrane protein